MSEPESILCESAVQLTCPSLVFQIVKVLEFIGKKEGLQLPPGFVARIAEKSGRSLRRAILSFETCRVQQLRSMLQDLLCFLLLFLKAMLMQHFLS